MKFKLPLSILAIFALGGASALYIARASSTPAASSGDEHGTAEKPPETVKGPNNGRLLTDGDFTLELAIFEDDVPPEFRAWFSKAGKPVAPSEVKLTVNLIRPGNKVDAFAFAPTGDFSRGDHEVGEPHSFSYEIIAQHAGSTHRWAFDAPEMQTVIADSAAQVAGMQLASAGPATLGESLAVYGQIKLNADKIARAVPRFGGIVQEARKSLGDSVKAGEVVALVETNQSLVTIEVKAPIAGVVVERDVTAGETVADGAALYTIADLADVWVELNIPKRDQSRVKIGQSVVIHADDGGEAATGKITWISPLSQTEAQTVAARVVLANPTGRWRPGLFIKAEVALSENPVAVAVQESGIQSLYAFTVVFSQHGELYQARPLELGRKGGGYVEVLKGLEAGERYVVDNSFLVKADIGKSGASHDH
jgi:membrane fusion protein, heavy metal efflux system